MAYEELLGRWVFPVTDGERLEEYYGHLAVWRYTTESFPRTVPTREDALEYVWLRGIENSLIMGDEWETRKKYKRLKLLTRRYDWRPQKVREVDGVGLIAPTGEALVPPYFGDVFDQFDAISGRPEFIPVSDGENWAIISVSDPPGLLTEFSYKAIVPERWEGKIIFVQDKNSMKWGALRPTYPILNQGRKFRQHVPHLKWIMPCIADDIYEDQLYTDCEPTLFFVARAGDKIGILTDFGHTPIIYDRFDTEDQELKFHLTSDSLGRTDTVAYHSPARKA